MNEDVDYWVSKVKWNGKQLEFIHAHKNNNNTISSYKEMARTDILYHMKNGYGFCSVLKKKMVDGKKEAIL